MKIRGVTPILSVSDVPASLRWFEAFGWSRGFTWNPGGMIHGSGDRNSHGPATFASVCSNVGGDAEGAQMFLCQDGQGARGGKPPRFDGSDDCGAVWMSWWVENAAQVDEAHAIAVKHGVTLPKI